MKRSTLSLPLVLGIAALLCSTPAFANSPMLHPNLQRGVDKVSKYQREFFPGLGMDLNLFNGNLGLTVALGKPYPLDYNDGYRFDLSYNSNIWDFDASGEAQASRFWNAGLGFDFSFGRLLEPGDAVNETGRWLYIDPRGTWHVFNSNLHAGYADVDDPDDKVLYTKDSTYYRLHVNSTSKVTLDSPGGQSRVFQKSGGEWRLIRYTAQGEQSWLDVTYSADGLTWTITDNHGRVHKAFFQIHVDTGRIVLDRLELAAFGGDTATWSLGYSTITTHLPCGQAGTITAPVLTSITGPLGYVQQLSYFTAGNSGCTKSGRLRSIELRSGGVLAWDYGDFDFPPASCGSFAGVPSVVPGVTSWRKELPNGSVHGEWTITPKALAPALGGAGTAAADPCDAVHRQVHVRTPLGDRHDYFFTVATKITKASDGVTILGGPAEYGVPIARSWRVGAGTGRGERALSEKIFDCDSAGQNCKLLRRVWEIWEQDLLCNSLHYGCFTEPNRRLRARRVTYDDEKEFLGSATFRDEYYKRFDGFGHYRIESVESNTHGGAVRKTSKTRGFNADRGVLVPAEGSYGGVPAGTSTFTMLPTAWRWTLNDYGHEQLWDAATNTFQRKDFCFDNVGNVLRERRRRLHDQRFATDVVVERQYSGGQPVSKAHYGANAGGVPTASNWCSSSLGTATYEVRNVYSHGVLAQSYHVASGGGRVYSEGDIDRTIDRNTGLIASERDVAGLETTYDYDLLGRRTWTYPSAAHGGARVQRVYRQPTGASTWPAGILITEYWRPNGGGSVLTWKRRWLDFFSSSTNGEEVRMPEGKLSRRRWVWGPLGRMTHESTSFDPSVGGLKWTLHLEQDALGRFHRIRPPEGAAHDTVIRFYGARKMERVVQAGRNYAGSATSTGNCYESAVTYTTEYDFKGRVKREVEDRPEPYPGLLRETSHDYDVADHRTRTESKRTVEGVTARSVQTWSYDGRGFLTKKTHNNYQFYTSSQTTHLNLDARGKPVRTKREGTSFYHPWTVRNIYDRAGRLVLVRDDASPDTEWKEFQYASSNTTGNYRRGKLIRAVRHNYWYWTEPQYPPTYSTIVEDTYEYKGVGGRQSGHEMYASREQYPPPGFPKKYRDEVQYDELGNLAEITYPWCLLCSPEEPQLKRRLERDYEGPFLVGLRGYKDGALDETWDESFEWDPAGRRIQRVVHGNGMVDRYESGVNPDTQHGRILVGSSGATCKQNCLDVDSGTFVYDGEGATCGVGLDKLTGPAPSKPIFSVFDTSSCSARAFRDPFGGTNGQHWESSDNTSCGGTDRFFYDAFDRLIAHTDQSATKEVQYAGIGWVWERDPDRWHQLWSLYGVAGQALRQVTVWLENGWWNTHDKIHGPLGLHGRERVIRSVTYPQVRHKHPMTYYETMAPNAYKMQPGTDDVDPEIF